MREETILEMFYEVAGVKKGVKAVFPGHFNVKQKHKASAMCVNALLRDEIKAERKAELAAIGLDYDAIVAESEAAKRGGTLEEDKT